MELKKVVINGRKTGLVVEGFDIQEDTIYLSAHRKEDEFTEMMSVIGNPNKTPTKKYENRIRKIFTSKGWDVGKIDFNYGYVTFELTTPRSVNHDQVAKVLGLPIDHNYPSVIPLMEINTKLTGHQTWIYCVNCRNEYHKANDGWPEVMRISKGKKAESSWF